MTKIILMTILVLGLSMAVVAGDSPESTAKAQQTGAVAKANELILDLGNKVTLKLVQIPAGKFLMGSPPDEKDRQDDEGLPRGKWVNGSPQVEVTISKPFYLGVYEVTVDQYAQFTKDTGQEHIDSDFQTGDHPVVFVNRDDAQAFCQWLSRKTGKRVVLPTEAQWEYACRAGSKTRFSFGDKDDDLGDYAWFDGNSQSTHPVGQKKPNAWGLYDMHGNVWEYCSDERNGKGYSGVDVDPVGRIDGGFQIYRGGSWRDQPKDCRSAYRDGQELFNLFGAITDFRSIFNGFRVAVLAAGEH